MSARRIAREIRTVKIMIDMFCFTHHAPRDRCPECTELSDYAEAKIDRCPLKSDKPICSACYIHCYRDQYRDRIRYVMRYSGPRMLTRHPLLALGHLLDRIRARYVDATKAANS